MFAFVDAQKNAFSGQALNSVWPEKRKGALGHLIFLGVFLCYFSWMQFENTKIILCHGVADLRKGAAGLLSLMDQPERDTWYLFSNRSRSLVKCVCRDRFGVWATSRRLNQGHFQWIERVAGSSRISAQVARELCLGRKPKIYE
jgi:hypothetical protein